MNWSNWTVSILTTNDFLYLELGILAFVYELNKRPFYFHKYVKADLPTLHNMITQSVILVEQYCPSLTVLWITNEFWKSNCFLQFRMESVSKQKGNKLSLTQ